MNIKVSKTRFFVISSILFLPLIAMMLTWFITVYVVVTLIYYPINLDDPIVMNQYYSHYQESKDNSLKYKVLVLGLDGVLESSLTDSNTPNIIPNDLSSQTTNYWTSTSRFPIPDYWSSANVKAAVRGGTIDWNTSKYQHEDTSFFTEALNLNTTFKGSSIQLSYPEDTLGINQQYIEPETRQKINAKDLAWTSSTGVNDPAVITNLFLGLIDAINSNNHLVFGFDCLSDEVAHHGWTVHTAKYKKSLWIENQYVKVLQELLAKREAEFQEKWMFLLFTDHGRDSVLDGQHHSFGRNALKAWYYTNQKQELIEPWINKPINSKQRGLVDIKSIITGYLGQN